MIHCLLSFRYVKDADKAIIAHLKAAGRMIDVSSYSHSYPFCWRSDTPLIYKVLHSLMAIV
jgi:isoleucyl-tRNA synthetase